MSDSTTKLDKQSKWQISLVEMLQLTTVFAALVSIGAYLYWTPFYWICLFFGTFITVAFAELRTRERDSILYVCLVGVAAFSSGLCMIISLATLCNCVMHFVLLVSTWQNKLTRRFTYKVSICLMLVSFGIGVAYGIPEYQRLREVRQEFPAVDLTNRLQPERNDAPVVAVPDAWNKYDYSAHHFGRIAQLQNLHDRAVEGFVKSPGFGVTRMFIVNPGDLAPVPISDIPFITTTNAPSADSRRFWAYDHRTETRVDLPIQFHLNSVLNFLNPETFGVAPPDQRIGFTPHAFLFPPSTLEQQDVKWELEYLQLISLTKFDSPTAYDLDHMPRMDEISESETNVPTRQLNEFEKGALNQLYQGQEIITTRVGDQLKMVGPILATEKCMECHRGKRGQILGAFTYAFKKK